MQGDGHKGIAKSENMTREPTYDVYAFKASITCLEAIWLSQLDQAVSSRQCVMLQ